MRSVLAAVALVLIGFALGRASAGWQGIDAVDRDSGAGSWPAAVQAGASSSSPVSFLDVLDDDDDGRAPSITAQVAEARRRNEGGAEARILRDAASRPGASPALLRRAAEAERRRQEGGEGGASGAEGVR
jgi:hypothetical protein